MSVWWLGESMIVHVVFSSPPPEAVVPVAVPAPARLPKAINSVAMARRSVARMGGGMVQHL